MFDRNDASPAMADRLAKIGDQLPVIGTIRRKRTRQNNVLRGLGVILFWVSLILLIPLASALLYGENILPFVITFVITLIASLTLVTLFGASRVYHHTDGTLMILTLWISLFIIGMIPYLLFGACGVVDALFESVSGFTTVGSTIFENVDALPKSLLLWRVLTQWIGGIIIVLLFMVILPMFVSGQRSIVKNDLQPTSTDYGVHMKVMDIAKQFILVYTGLTLLFTLLIWLSGFSFDHAFHLALSTISIGGFTYSSSSLADINALQKILIALLMIVSATNFYLHFRAIVKTELKVYFEDTEFKAMIVWYLILTIAMFIVLKDKFVDGFFMIISLGTTTGFVSDPTFTEWGSAAISLLILAMFVGGSSGSPAGGIKLSRLIIILKSLAIDAYEVVNSSVIQVPKLNGQPIDEKKVHNAYAVFTLFVIVVAISSIVYSLFGGLDVRESIFASFSIATATGTCVGSLASSFAAMPVLVKLYTCVLMLFARMEMISLLAIFMPRFWQEVMRNENLEDTSTGGLKLFRKE